MNATWHHRHPMPEKPTPIDRLEWHLAHQRACDCRELTRAALEKLEQAAARYDERVGRRAKSAR